MHSETKVNFCWPALAAARAANSRGVCLKQRTVASRQRGQAFLNSQFPQPSRTKCASNDVTVSLICHRVSDGHESVLVVLVEMPAPDVTVRFYLSIWVFVGSV